MVKKIALIHPSMIVGGGSETITLWAAEALKEQYAVSIISSVKIDLDQCNDFYNTGLKQNEIRFIQVKPPFLLKNQRLFNALRDYRLARYCKSRANEYDLMFSTYNPMDFGKRGIQYILDPNFNEEMLRLLNPVPATWMKWFYKDYPLRKLYLFLGHILSNYTVKGMRKNMTLVDSHWAGELTYRHYGLRCRTVYPPVTGEFDPVPFQDRSNGFVCIGRIVRDKQLEKIIQIIQKTRERIPDVHLHIIGKESDRFYYQKIAAISKKHTDFIHFDGVVSAEQKTEILSHHKYGIHGKRNEPFGIAVAEMVKAGLIVWVPDGGGQVEIVNHDDLIYKTEEEAVAKIENVMESVDKQKMLLKHLEKQAGKFSSMIFMSEIKSIVKGFFEENEKRAP